MDEGIIKSTGNLIQIQLPSGSWINVPEPEEMNTLKVWESRKLKLKEGELPVTRIKTWKPYKNKDSQGVIFKFTDFYIRSQFEEIKGDDD